MSLTKETFSQISPSEFFYRNRDLAGFSNPTRSLYTSVREFVENALDACDQKKILPDIHLSIKAVDPEIDMVIIASINLGDKPRHLHFHLIPKRKNEKVRRLSNPCEDGAGMFFMA